VAYLLVAIFFLFFYNQAFIVSTYKKPHAALAMEKTKGIILKGPPVSPLHGQNQRHGIDRKSASHLAPKIKYHRHIRRQLIETYRRDTQTHLQARQ